MLLRLRDCMKEEKEKKKKCDECGKMDDATVAYCHNCDRERLDLRGEVDAAQARRETYDIAIGLSRGHRAHSATPRGECFDVMISDLKNLRDGKPLVTGTEK